MKPLKIPDSYNYCSAFLTFSCNYKCHYCINKYNGLYRYKHLTAKDWIRGLSRVQAREDLPITLTGGEPNIFKGFYDIANKVKKPMDLLTNGSFCAKDFTFKVKPSVFKREAPYASIRFSYHPGYTPLNLITKTKVLLHKGYDVGIWAVDTGSSQIKAFQVLAKTLGIDFRLKEFLDSTHGNYRYPEAVNGKKKKCLCRPSELLIAPDGRLFRCHYDLYHGVNSYGHILKTKELPDDFMPCENMGLCSPCDIKQKYNRFQEKGHCAVEIIQ